jgi:hypothetical protein
VAQIFSDRNFLGPLNMFVRVRQIPNDRREPPRALNPIRLCEVPLKDGTPCPIKEHYAHCRLKPRCPWALPVGENQVKSPYRLKLTLIDGGRAVVQLGSIEGYWLKDFWPEPPEIWRWHSIIARKRFWDTALTNMAEVGDNRLSAEDRKRIRKMIHKTVPWVMKWELKQAELFDLEHDYKYVKGTAERTEKEIAGYKETIGRLQKENIERAEALASHLRFMSGVAEEVKKLRDE